MAGEKDSFSLDESQTIKTSFKINKVPTNADALVLANQGAFGAGEFVITPDEDVNLSQMRTKVLWTNPNINNAFGAQTVTFENNETFDYFLIISRYNINVDSYVSHFGEVGKGIHITDVRAKSGSHFAMYERSAGTTQNSVTFSDADEQYTDGSFVVSNITLVPYQIIGFKKSPAMIYTGAELHEGNGISIENGVISATNINSEVLLYNSSGVNSGTITLGDISPYKFITIATSDDNNFKTINVYSVKSLLYMINNNGFGIYGYSSNFINCTCSGSINNFNLNLSSYTNQKILAI